LAPFVNGNASAEYSIEGTSKNLRDRAVEKLEKKRELIETLLLDLKRQ
jgi:hypothetical protein